MFGQYWFHYVLNGGLLKSARLLQNVPSEYELVNCERYGTRGIQNLICLLIVNIKAKVFACMSSFYGSFGSSLTN